MYVYVHTLTQAVCVWVLGARIGQQVATALGGSSVPNWAPVTWQ